MGRDKSVTRGAAYRAEEAKWRIEEASFGHALYLVAEELRARVEGYGASEGVTTSSLAYDEPMGVGDVGHALGLLKAPDLVDPLAALQVHDLQRVVLEGSYET